MHEVAVGADPDAGRVPAQFCREVLLVDHRAVDHVPGHARRVVHVLRAHDRLSAVGVDERLALVALAVGAVHGDARVILLDAFDAGAGQELDPARLLRALEQRQVNVDAVDHGVRVAEALAEGLAGGDAGDQRLVERVVHHHAVGLDGSATRLLADAERVEGVKGVRAKLDAGANLADRGGLLEHLDREALAHQRERGGEAANAAAGDQHGQ